MGSKKSILDVPELRSILDIKRNELSGIDVLNLSLFSSTKVFWKCENGHTFQETAKTLISRKNKCHYCSGRQVWLGENDLKTLFPSLAEEFDVTRNGKTPDSISPKDTANYWWTCTFGHPSFLQSVYDRVDRKTKCPYCTGRWTLKGENDLQTLFPEIAKEWDADKNGGLTPLDVSPYTYKSFWWICPKGHSYKKKVIQRTKYHKPIDCPFCIKAHSTSFPEQAIFFYVKKCFPEALNRYKTPFDNGMELDIYVPSYGLGIEYDGAAFHESEDQHNRELKKYDACKQLGIKLVRIKETTETWNDTADKFFYVEKRMNDLDFSLFLSSMFRDIFGPSMHIFAERNSKEAFLNRLYGFPTDFDVARDRPEILEYLVDVEHSFGIEHPETAKMWDKEGNGKLTPFMFTSGSTFLAVWKCPKCGETWKSPIGSIVSRKVKSCKKCSMQENGKATTKRRTAENGSLAARSAFLLSQWDYGKNGALSPYEIPLNYNRKVAWKCNKCGYEWWSSPNARAGAGRTSDCPHCTGRVALAGVDDLQTLYPEIVKEWDKEKNGTILPSQIRPFSNKKYYWICPVCNYSYATLPGNRIQGHGCPKCAQIKVGRSNSKLVGQFDEKRTLIRSFQGLHEAARAMQVNANAIFQAVKSGGKSKGYYWSYILDEEDGR